MKKRNILIMLLLSFTLIGAGCSNTFKDEKSESVDVEEIIVEDKETPEKEVNEEQEEEVNEEQEEEVSEEQEEEVSSTSWFDTTKNLDTYYYEVSTDLADGTTFITKVWSSENKTKMESDYPETGETVIMIMNNDENVMYMYMPAENTAIMMQYDGGLALMDEDEQDGAQDYVEIMRDLADDDEITIEDGTFEGETVKIVTGEIDGNMNKIWISDKTGFPLKSEFYMDGELESSATFTTFEETMIDPSTFELPEDVVIQDLTNF